MNYNQLKNKFFYIEKIFSTKIPFIILLVIFSNYSTFCQDKLALKGLKKISLDIRFLYDSGSAKDYRDLLISEYDIRNEATLILKLYNLELSKSLIYPSLVIQVELNSNSRNFSSGSDGWFNIRSKIFLNDKVRLHRNQKIEFIAKTWEGNSVEMMIKESERYTFDSSDIIDALVKPFLLDYLEMNPR